MDFLKTMAGKIISGLVGLFLVICIVSWFRTDSATRDVIVTGTGRIAVWCGMVLVLPWIAFALIGWVARRESNQASALLVGLLSVGECVGLAWLFHWSVRGATAWSFLIFGGLVAALYNLLTCDWIAEKVE